MNSNLSISRPLKPQTFLGLQPSLLDPGETQDSLKQLSPQDPIIDTTFLASREPLITIRQQRLQMKRKTWEEKRSGSATVELAAENKQMILGDKKNTSSQTFPTIRLSQTQDQVSITNVKAFSAYSKTQLTEISKNLWLPIETDWLDSGLSSSNGSFCSTGSNSLCSIKVLKNPKKKSVQTSCLSFTYFPVVSMAKEDTPKKQKKKPKKIYTKREQIKVPCRFPILKKIQNKKYAIICNKASDNGKCEKHLHVEEPTNYDSFWPWTCRYSLIGPRRGFQCGVKCDENKNYCKSHLKSVIPVDSVIRCFKVRYYPTIKEKKTLHKWFGDTRAIYNTLKAVDCQDKFEDARAAYVNLLDYTKTTPKEVRAFAIKEFVTGRDTAESMYEKRLAYYKEDISKRRKPTEPCMKFRFKKDQQCLTIPKSAVTLKNGSLKIYPRYIPKPLKLDCRTIPNSKGLIKDKKWASYVQGHPTHDIKILRTRTDRFYVCISYDALPETPKTEGVTAIDKGSRKFMVCYSPQEVLSIAEHKHEIFRKVRRRLNELKQSRSSGKKIRLVEEKLTNRVNDLHFKTIKYLTETYSTIILPKFSSKNCIQSPDLHPLAKFMLQRYCHYRFDQRLKSKAEITGTDIKCGSEWGSTKTCTNCFDFHPVEGETHTCPNCGFSGDRDMLASRSILIKHIKTITINSIESESPRDC